MIVAEWSVTGQFAIFFGVSLVVFVGMFLAVSRNAPKD